MAVLNERTYVKETGLSLWESLAWVILGGVLLSLVGLPAILLALIGFVVPAILVGALTLGPGWASMTSLIAKSILRVQGLSPLDFFRDFARFYWRGAGLGALFAVPLLAANWTLLALAQQDEQVFWVGLAGDAAILFFLTALSLYAYPQLVLYDVSLKVALRNSLVLAIRYLWNTLGLLGLAVLLGMLAGRISWILLVILPAMWMVFVINNCRMVVRIETGEPDNSHNPG